MPIEHILGWTDSRPLDNISVWFTQHFISCQKHSQKSLIPDFSYSSRKDFCEEHGCGDFLLFGHIIIIIISELLCWVTMAYGLLGLLLFHSWLIISWWTLLCAYYVMMKHKLPPLKENVHPKISSAFTHTQVGLNLSFCKAALEQ